MEKNEAIIFAFDEFLICFIVKEVLIPETGLI